MIGDDESASLTDEEEKAENDYELGQKQYALEEYVFEASSEESDDN